MRILSVNVGSSRQMTVKHRTIQTGIYKTPVTGPVTVTRFGLEGDLRVETRKMGLEHSAIYAYPYEHYEFWQRELGCDAFPMGQFGENLTVIGMLEEEVRIGDIFRVGGTVMQVAHPRIPCAKLNERMGLRFSTMFLASRKVGYYLRVLSEGSVAVGDAIELLERDEASPTMEEFVRVTQFEYWDAEGLQNLLRARDLMPGWREIIEEKLVRTRAASGWHGLREFEVVRREQESADTVSLYLKCVRGRPLPSFRGGQQLVVVLGVGSAQQQRRPYFLTSSPLELSTYRITVRHTPGADQPQSDCSVSAHLVTVQVGARLFCTAPYGTTRPAPQGTRTAPTAVLLSQGLGIAPILSLLYELEGRQAHVTLLHEATANDPQGLRGEVSALMARNPDFQMIQPASDVPSHIDTELLQLPVPPAQAEVHIAGSSGFIETLTGKLTALGFDSATFIVYRID